MDILIVSKTNKFLSKDGFIRTIIVFPAGELYELIRPLFTMHPNKLCLTKFRDHQRVLNRANLFILYAKLIFWIFTFPCDQEASHKTGIKCIYILINILTHCKAIKQHKRRQQQIMLLSKYFPQDAMHQNLMMLRACVSLAYLPQFISFSLITSIVPLS